jgi:hypothetical protein
MESGKSQTGVYKARYRVVYRLQAPPRIRSLGSRPWALLCNAFGVNA